MACQDRTKKALIFAARNGACPTFNHEISPEYIKERDKAKSLSTRFKVLKEVLGGIAKPTAAGAAIWLVYSLPFISSLLHQNVSENIPAAMIAGGVAGILYGGHRIFKKLENKLQLDEQLMSDVIESEKWSLDGETREQGFIRLSDTRDQLIRLKDKAYLVSELKMENSFRVKSDKKDDFWVMDGGKYARCTVENCTFTMGKGKEGNTMNRINISMTGVDMQGKPVELTMDYDKFIKTVKKISGV